MNTQHQPTDEQQACIQAAANPQASGLMVSAYAGCAKTTTLCMMAAAAGGAPGLALAFNKRIAEELKGRLPANYASKTMNGLGFAAWARRPQMTPTLRVDDKKLGKLVTQTAADRKIRLAPEDWLWTRQSVERAQQLGLLPSGFANAAGASPLIEDSYSSWLDIASYVGIPQSSTASCIDLAKEVLERDIDLALQGQISFDDQIYCPTVLGGLWPRYPTVMIDESQDLSSIQHEILRRVMRPGGLIVAVGDPKQAIYAWRGADSQSMQTIRQLAASWQDLSLTLTFRCPQAIVDRQQAHAPGFRAAPQAPQGSIIFLEGYTYDGPPRGWQWSSIDSPQVAVLCRNNAPLLSLAFKLLRQGIGVQMLGRDIGTNLIALARKLCPSDELSRLDCVTRIQSWRESEGASAIAAGHDSKAESITDRADCLLAVLSSTECSNAGEMRQLLEQMFAPSASQVVLSSIHRAKGLEWPYVFHLDPWRIPSRFAHSAEAKQQERNLQYVCETRTQSVLAHASLSEMESP